jgi:hypothetical protein
VSLASAVKSMNNANANAAAIMMIAGGLPSACRCRSRWVSETYVATPNAGIGIAPVLSTTEYYGQR